MEESVMEEMLSRLTQDSLYYLEGCLLNVEFYVSGWSTRLGWLFIFAWSLLLLVALRADATNRLKEQVEKLERELEWWR